MNEAMYVFTYVQALTDNNAITMQAILWALPIVMMTASDMFIVQMAVAGGKRTPMDALALADPGYAHKPEYALVATAVDALMMARQDAIAKCVMMQERIHETINLTK